MCQIQILTKQFVFYIIEEIRLNNNNKNMLFQIGSLLIN
jgi:hypothetical protein